MARIESIRAREVIDSRGIPTVQAVVNCAGGISESAMVPAGSSTGVHEALELRDRDDSRYFGYGVLSAVESVNNEIQRALIGYDTGNQQKIDRRMLELDGTVNKSRLGANAILAVSLACARAEARAQNIPLYSYLRQLFPKRDLVMPVPQINVMNGGKHANNHLAIQAFHILPVGAKNFATALRMGIEIYQSLKKLLLDAGIQVGIGDEGGLAPVLQSTEDAFVYITSAIEKAGYIPGVDVYLGIDASASEFYDAERQGYDLDGVLFHSHDLAFRYKTWKERYGLISLEDIFDQDAWADWTQFTAANGINTQIVGDDIFVTNAVRIQEGIARGVANAVLIKPNQIGTLTETLQAVLVAQEADYNVIVSHRAGETEDTFIADLAVAVGAGQIKMGAPARSDRTSKYNRLLQIEDEIHPSMSHSLQRFLEHQSVTSSKITF